MTLLIDNYDSFSYNLYQIIGQLSPDIKVIRNDEYTVQQIRQMQPNKIIISPGPGRPAQAGICIPLIQQIGPHIPILGVCLGHQAICAAYGATISYAKHLMHGKQSTIHIATESLLFKGLPEQIRVARYHSLAATQITKSLKITATTIDGEIMAVEHIVYPVYGVQFHPESILTPDGIIILTNFLRSEHND